MFSLGGERKHHKRKITLWTENLREYEPPKLNIADGWVVVFVVLEMLSFSFQIFSIEHALILHL